MQQGSSLPTQAMFHGVQYRTTAVSLFFVMLHPSKSFSATASLIGSNGSTSSYCIYSATIEGYFVMSHWCESKFPVDIAAHVSTWQMNDTSSFSVFPNLNKQPGSLLSTVSGIGGTLSMAWFNRVAVMTKSLPLLVGDSSLYSASVFRGIAGLSFCNLISISSVPIYFRVQQDPLILRGGVESLLLTVSRPCRYGERLDLPGVFWLII